MRIAIPARVVCCLLILAQSLSGSEGDDVVESTVHARVSAIIDVVLDHHIDPPTRQEMILSGVRALYQPSWQTNPQSAKRIQPRGLSRRVSELLTTDDIKKFLDEVMMEFDTVRGAEDVLVHGTLECVRGGASLRNAEFSRVSDQVATNRYVGTGIALGGNGSKENAFAIRKVIYNGPAWKAGAKGGDLIAGIDEKTTDNMQLNQVLEALRGEAGSKVTMLVRQPNETETRKLVVTRGRVFFPSIEGYRLVSEGRWKYSIDADPNVALIRLKNIGPSTLHELRQIEDALRNEGVRGVVIDLRAGGALLHDVVMVADALVDGAVTGHVRSLDGRKTHVARRGMMFKDMPMAVLTSRFTSAGHVFLAAALQDSGRAEVFGERTPGNTYVRSRIDIPGRDEQITIATAVMERADGTPLLIPPSRRTENPMVAMERSATQKKKQTSFILPDHEINKKANRGGDVIDHVVKVATASIRHRIENGNAAGDTPTE